jgi:hypothetical protein
VLPIGPTQCVHVTRTRNFVTLRRTLGTKMYAMYAKIHTMYAVQPECVHVHVHVTRTRDVATLRRTLVSKMYALHT